MYHQRADILQRMDSDFIKKFMEITVKESYKKGDFIFHRGQKAVCFYILVGGHVRLITGFGGHVVHVIDGTGEAFGWSSLMGRDSYSASAECVMPTKVLKIENTKCRELLEKHPASGLIFYRGLAKILGDRLIRNYEMMPGISQSHMSPTYGSRQVTEMGMVT